MPERPDLEYFVPILAEELAGAEIEAVHIDKPVVLRVLLPEKVDALLPGRAIEGVARRAHFVRFALSGEPAIEMIISPMLAGRFTIVKTGQKAPRDTAMTFDLRGGRSLLYRDDVQMGKVYVLAKGAIDAVPGAAKIGVDVLDPKAFTRDAFVRLAKARRDQAKVFLMDKSALDAMGNAYADEVLFEAGIHPKAMVRSLDAEQLGRMHAAIVKVLGEARRTIAERKPAIDEKLRDFLKVRGRPGEPCVRCGTKLRRAGVHGHDAIFCPECQPDGRKSALVDWRKVK
ncbi:MAG: DNA-formamidopyrimidine glycosylase family protein [Polyangiaceae bacterium]